MYETAVYKKKHTDDRQVITFPQKQRLSWHDGKSTTLAKQIETTAHTWHRRVICRACTRLCLAFVPVSIFFGQGSMIYWRFHAVEGGVEYSHQSKHTFQDIADDVGRSSQSTNLGEWLRLDVTHGFLCFLSTTWVWPEMCVKAKYDFKCAMCTEKGSHAKLNPSSIPSSPILFLTLRLNLQYCRVPKNGLPKNGQAGISSKNKNDLRLEKWVKNGFTTRKRLLWRQLLRRHCLLRHNSTSTGWNISAAFPTWHASSRTVCTLEANLVTRRLIEK